MHSDTDRVDKIEVFLEDTTLEEFLADNDLTIPEALFLLWQDGHLEFPDWSDLDLESEDNGD